MPVYKMQNISHRSFTFHTLSLLHFHTFAFYNFLSGYLFVSVCPWSYTQS